MALEMHGALDYAALQAALSDKKTDELILSAFDLLSVEVDDLRDLPLRDRKAPLKSLLARADGQGGVSKERAARFIERKKGKAAARARPKTKKSAL